MQLEVNQNMEQADFALQRSSTNQAIVVVMLAVVELAEAA
jgi:hypothetical protein